MYVVLLLLKFHLSTCSYRNMFNRKQRKVLGVILNVFLHIIAKTIDIVFNLPSFPFKQLS